MIARILSFVSFPAPGSRPARLPRASANRRGLDGPTNPRFPPITVQRDWKFAGAWLAPHLRQANSAKIRVRRLFPSRTVRIRITNDPSGAVKLLHRAPRKRPFYRTILSTEPLKIRDLLKLIETVGFSAHVPDLRGCIAAGDTRQETLDFAAGGDRDVLGRDARRWRSDPRTFRRRNPRSCLRAGFLADRSCPHPLVSLMLEAQRSEIRA